MTGCAPTTRLELLDEILAFCAGSDGAAPSRSRAVAVVADAGLGKSWLLDRVRERAAASGATIIVLDDVDLLDDPEVCARHLVELATDGASIVMAARNLPAQIRAVLDRRFDRRVVELAAYSRGEARMILETVGVHPWSLRAASLLDVASGSDGISARELIDAAYAQRTLGLVTPDAETGIWLAEHQLLAAWFTAWARCDVDALHELVDCAAVAAATDDDAAALLVLAEHAISEGQFDEAIELGERAVTAAGPLSLTARWAATTAACIRGLRGETIGVQSLHAIAAHAQRHDDVLLEAHCMYRLSIVHSSRGDLELAALAARRGIELAECSNLHLRALNLRNQLALVDRFRGDDAAAMLLFVDVIDAARAGGADLRFCHVMASCEYADILLARGDIATARVLAEEALAQMPEHGIF